jgi:hypothetical protein
MVTLLSSGSPVADEIMATLDKQKKSKNIICENEQKYGTSFNLEIREQEFYSSDNTPEPELHRLKIRDEFPSKNVSLSQEDNSFNEEKHIK